MGTGTGSGTKKRRAGGGPSATRAAVPAAVVLLLGLLAATAAVADPARLVPRLDFRLGALAAEVDTTLRLDEPGDLGTPVDLESELGLDDSDTVPRLELEVTAGRRHTFSLGWFALDRDATAVVEETIVFGDEVFEVDAEVASFFDLEVLEAAYTFWPVVGEDVAFGLRLGAALLRLEAGIDALGDAGGVGVAVAEDTSSDLPAPQVGGELRVGLAHRLLLRGGFRWIDVDDVGDFSGSLLQAEVALEHQTLRNLGFGVAYSLFDLSLDVEEGELAGEGDLTIDGVRAYVKLGIY